MGIMGWLICLIIGHHYQHGKIWRDGGLLFVYFYCRRCGRNLTRAYPAQLQ